MAIWWPIYPQQFRGVFTRAFTTGLHDASLYGRVTEGTWRRALLRLNDSVSTCPQCRAAVFFDSEQSAQRCWDCGAALPVPPRLYLPGGALVLTEGALVTRHHLYRDREYRAAPGSSGTAPAPGRRPRAEEPDADGVAGDSLRGGVQDRSSRPAASGAAHGHRLQWGAWPDTAAGHSAGSHVPAVSQNGHRWGRFAPVTMCARGPPHRALTASGATTGHSGEGRTDSRPGRAWEVVRSASPGRSGSKTMRKPVAGSCSTRTGGTPAAGASTGWR